MCFRFTANHFIEWQADYHHPTLSHSLLAHDPYPTELERTRFLRAYIGCDGGYDELNDNNLSQPSPSTSTSNLNSESGIEGGFGLGEDSRVIRLKQEVELWEPSSHAMWSVWGIVQSKEDLMFKIDKWKKGCQDLLAAKESSLATNGINLKNLNLNDGDEESSEREGRDGLTRGKRGEEGVTAEIEVEPEADFDYLSYALVRTSLFREELEELGVC